jgi:hypothetical protein
MLSDKISKSVEKVTKTWTKQKKAEIRSQNAIYSRVSRMCVSCSGPTFKDVAHQVLPAAYAKASGDGRYPANARQIMYAARGPLLKLTGKESITTAYFTQTLLPEYVKSHPSVTADWDVIYDARGHFREPHTDKEVPLGTLEVRGYLYEVSKGDGDDPFNIAIELARKFPTIGPANRFGAILFIEKEGFMPLIRSAKLSERFDIAIMSSKGRVLLHAEK